MDNKINRDTLQTPSNSSESRGTLGTFAGVFTPSILTILGIILFLRLGYVVGNAGLGHALIILFLANGISVLTSVSLSAVATNLKIKGGGDYYLISRTLGHEFGGAIGIVVFLAQSVSIAFYCLGFGEVLANLFSANWSILPQIIAGLAVSFLFFFAWLGADWATRFQYVVMTVLVAAIISFFIGGYLSWDQALLADNWSSPQTGPGFWVLFAIFFPAVTGFTQGVSMSGDLQDPGKSLPRGTFMAVGVSIVVYFVSALILAAALPAEILINDYGAMKNIAFFGFLVTAGVIAATLSSAMASFLGAPRILQSLAADRIFPFLVFFAKGSGPTANPRRGVLLSAGIAYATVAWGQLNLIAPVVSMFFLISYGLINYATYFEARSQSPSFRPRFRYFNKWLSLAGALACLGVMLAIDIAAGLVAAAVLFGIYQYLRRTAGPSRWADSRRSHHLQAIREHLLAASENPEHARDWRPLILAFSDNTEQRAQLLHFSSWIEGGSGLTSAVQILEGEGPRMLRLKAQAEAQLQRDIQKDEARAFPLVVTASNLEVGIQAVVQAYGVGSFKANTILLNWHGRTPARGTDVAERQFGRNLRAAYRQGCNIVVLDVKADKWAALEETDGQDRCIDVWWWGGDNGKLMLLLAYLMTRDEKWDEAKIRLLVGVEGNGDNQTIESLTEMLEEVRIEATPEIVKDVDADTLAEYSADSSLVFLPFRIRDDQVLDPFGNPMEDTLFLLPVTAMVMAAEEVDLDAEPEEGKAGEIAEARDALEDARKLAQAAAKEAAQAVKTAEKAREKVEDLTKNPEGVDEQTRSMAAKTAEEADKQAVKMTRKAAKAAAKVEIAAREAEASGAIQEDSEGD